MAEKIIRRRGDIHQRKQAHNNLAEIGALRAEYNAWKSKLKELEDAHDHEKAKQNRANETYLKVQDQLSQVEEEIDCDPLPEGAQPKVRIQRRDALAMQLLQLDAALKAQKKSTQSALDLVHDAERKLFVSDKNLNKFVDNLEDTEAAVSVQQELDKERSERLAKLEVKRAQRWENEQKMSLQSRASQVQELTKLASKQVSTAKLSHKKASMQILEANENTKQTSEQLKSTEQEHQDRRTKVVMDLKANITKVRHELATNSEKQLKKIADAKQELEDQKEAMLSKGMNPYIEFRKKEFDADAEARERKMRSKVENNKVELTERMLREEETRRREEAIEMKAYEYEKKFRESQGRKGGEEKVRDYLKSITVGGKEILDPTGKEARVDPSQVTEVSDFSFGLGKSARISRQTMEKITEKIRQGLKVDRDDLGEYERLVVGLLPPEEKEKLAATKSKKSGGSGGDGGMRSKNAAGGDGGSGAGGTRVTFSDSVDDGTAIVDVDGEDAETRRKREKIAFAAKKAKESKIAELQTLADLSGIMPGLSKAAVTVNLPNEIEKNELLKLAEEEAGGSLKNATGVEEAKSPKYKPVPMSKFEQDSFARAKDRQRARVEEGSVQVAGGRVFTGPAFVPKPAEILFKDFKVGKTYKRTFTLTNASYTFNSFKILPLDNEIIDFFIVTYDRPGRMSAGVSCTIEVAFQPQLNSDIRSRIRLQTETGPVEIPLICLIRRCAPRIETASIDFGRVVIGQLLTQQMKITNSQALGTAIAVTRLEEPRPASQSNRQVLFTESTEGGLEGDDEASLNNMDDVVSTADAGSLGSGDVDGGSETGNLPPETSSRPSSMSATRTHGPNSRLDEKASGGEDDLTDMEGELEMGMEPAQTEPELELRVKRVLTDAYRRKYRVNPQPLTFHAPEGFVEGYQGTSLEVTCAPLKVGEFVQRFSVLFATVKNAMETLNDQGNLVTREQIVTVRVQADQLPIYVDEAAVDMKSTLHGRIYRKRLEVKNRGAVSYRVNVSVPPPYNSYIEVNPPMMFVQSMGSQVINIKFTPTPEILRRLAHFCMPYADFLDAALVHIPIKMQVVNQEIPVYFILKSTVCSPVLQLSTHSIDFGKIYVNQKSTQLLTVKNTSMQPQKVAFVRLKKEITVAPNDGFAALLPNESMTFEVSFTPMSSMDYCFDVTLQSSLNDVYPIKVLAKGIESPITFTATTVHMRTTGPGERVVSSVLATNNSKKKQCFEVLSPNPCFSWLKVSPSIIELQPGKSGRIEFEYSPPANAQELDPATWRAQMAEELSASPLKKNTGADVDPFEVWEEDSGWVFGTGMFGELQWVKKGASSDVDGDTVMGPDGEAAATDSIDGSDGGEGGDNQKEGKKKPVAEDVPEGEWGVAARWRLPVFIKNRAKLSAATITASGAGTLLHNGSDLAASMAATSTERPGSAFNNAPPPLFLNVETVVTLPQLVIDEKSLDFGQVAVGTRQIKTFRISNLSYEPRKLRSDGINAVGPFTLITPLTTDILPGTTKSYMVECMPLRNGLNVEVLELTQVGDQGGHAIRVTLRAEGVKPTVELKGLSPPPAGWSKRSGLVDFGNVLACDVVSQKFTVFNRSLFSVDININRFLCMGLSQYAQAPLIERTAAGLPLITFRPERAVIAPNMSQEIEVTFAPDRARLLPFREDLLVRVGTTEEVIAVGVYARAWPRQTYIATGNPAEEPFVKNLHSNPSAYVEDLLMSHNNYEVRSLAIDTAKSLHVRTPPPPPITLEYPNPYRGDVDPLSYVESDGGASAGGGKAAKGAPPVAAVKGRMQTKRILVGSAKAADARPGLGNGTFEVVLGDAAKDSGMWAVSVDKGVVNMGTEVPVDFMCTLPHPKGIGGLAVGSWRTYSAEVVIKGGWVAQGATDEERVPIVLKAFVSL